ncbi:MAG TPA: HAD family phosphatase [Anaerolineales bacterium]|nr:HAD family phosphatase [Anaerolineales bacterium]
MSQNIRAIIFDFGNVLLEWNPRLVYRRFFRNEQEMERFLHDVNFMDWNLQQDKGRSFAEGVSELSKEFPQYAELIQAYHDNWIDSIGNSLTGTIEIMKRLKNAGYPLYGLSNWSAETFPIARDKYEFFSLLEDIVISGEVGAVKPDPEIFEILLRRIGRPASECLFIDDALANIEAARTLGFATVHFQSPEQLENELQKLELL